MRTANSGYIWCLVPFDGEKNGEPASCADVGILPPIVGLAGVVQAMAALKVLLNLDG